MQQFIELFLKAERGLSVDMSTIPSEDENSRVGHQNGSQDVIKPIYKPQKKHSPKLSSVLVQYLKKQRLDGVSEKTLRDKKAIVELFIRIVGDKPIREYQRKHTQGFKDKALKLPPCVQRKPKQSIESLIAKAETTISITTFNNYLNP